MWDTQQEGKQLIAMMVGSWGEILTFTFLALQRFYLYLCFCGVCACMHTHAPECRWRCKDIRSSGAGIGGRCDPPDGGVGN